MSLPAEDQLKPAVNVPKEKLRQHLLSILEGTHLMALATSSRNVPWACTLAFAYDSELDIYFVSNRETRHAMELAENQHVSLALYVHQEHYDITRVKGLQLEGHAKALSGPQMLHGILTYTRRFPRSRRVLIGKPRTLNKIAIFRVRPTKLFLLDKEAFGQRIEILI